ncbi:MAG TPA: TetR/AcrR family transcriptional regulator [Acidimicrobiales bacterium]|nr:TetR/AcrR family transcriptional regulator [Acidimicrobiales bacterium]
MPTSAAAESDKPSAPRSQKGARTRARLLEAAKEVFEEDGFLEARISDIAERAGLSHGSFYHYFDSKEEIFREVAEAVEDQLSAPLGGVILDPESHAPPHERIREALRRHLESYRREAKIMGVIEQMSRHDKQVRDVRTARHEHYQRLVSSSIRALQEHGLADPELDPKIAAAALGAMTSRFPEMWLVQGAITCSFDKAVDQLTRMFVNVLGLSVEHAGSERRTRAS